MFSTTVNITEVPEHPKPFVTVTVIGLSAIVTLVVAVASPVDHKYVAKGALVDNVEKLPVQYVAAPLITGTGLGLTVTVAVQTCT